MTTSVRPDPYEEALRSLIPMDSTEALRRLQGLILAMPNLQAVQGDLIYPPETLKWLGDLLAVARAMKVGTDEISLNFACDRLVGSQGTQGADEIRTILYRLLAIAELKAPASEQGAFIAAGNSVDAYAAITKVFASASQNLLVVDPYMDGQALIDFFPSANEGVALRILADAASVKSTLTPASEKWAAQFQTKRPLEVRLSPARSLHDRLVIVDQREAWSITQSLKDFANRAHGAVMKADSETASLKIDAYEQLRSAASPL